MKNVLFTRRVTSLIAHSVHCRAETRRAMLPGEDENKGHACKQHKHCLLNAIDGD
jgi:hypothetical protein